MPLNRPPFVPDPLNPAAIHLPAREMVRKKVSKVPKVESA